MSAKKDGQEPGRRGRPPGPASAPGKPRPGHPRIATHDGHGGHDGPPEVVEGSPRAGDGPVTTPEGGSPGDIPDDRRIRNNGTPVPLVVQKLSAIVEHQGIKNVRLESPEGGGIGENRLYHWKRKAGQPSVPQIVHLANFLDVPLEYLIDDNIGVQNPPPRRWESGTYKVLDAANSLGLDIDDVERYLMVVKLAVTFGVDPERAMKMIATGSVERKDYLDGGNTGTGGPARPGSGPKWHPTTPTVDERAARDDAARESENRKNGGPRPRNG